MSKLPDYHPDTYLRIENPTGRARSYRIRYKEPEGNWTVLKLPGIDLANKLWQDGVVSEEHTVAKLKTILAAQYTHRDRKKKKAPFMSKNLELVERMWEEKYNRRKLRSMKRPERSKKDLISAAEACGLLPLDTCDLEDLADYLDKTLGEDPNKLARRITWVNSILQWLGRNKLQTTARTRLKVKYINEAEFLEMIGHITDPTTKTLARIAFYTGARIGEIFFIQPRHVKKNNVLFLELQMLDTEVKGGTFKEDTLKNGNEREVFYPPQVAEDLATWAKVPFKERYLIRKAAYSKRIARACVKAFGEEDPVKVLNFHDLRHCNAIWLLQKGATLIEVAQQLGNGPEVCYKYYSGYELKKESVERLKRLM